MENMHPAFLHQSGAGHLKILGKKIAAEIQLRHQLDDDFGILRARIAQNESQGIGTPAAIKNGGLQIFGQHPRDCFIVAQA